MLAKQPALHRQSEFYWTAYQKLSRDRPATGFGTGLIPLASIRDYSDRIGMDVFEARFFERVIMAVDSHQAELISNRQQARQAEMEAHSP